MNVVVALVVMVAGGGLAALQAPLNARLGRHTGSLPAAVVSFLVGFSVLGVLVVATGKAGDLGGIADVDPIYLLGGVVGASYVATTLVVVPKIGAGALSAAIITGQLGAGVLIIDRLGILGLEPTPVTLERAAGVVLLVAGTYAITRRM